MSRNILIVLIISIMALWNTGTAMGACDIAVYDADKGEVQIPCVDLGLGTCFTAALKVDVDPVTTEILITLKDVRDTGRAVPSGPEAEILSVYYPTMILDIPVLSIEPSGYFRASLQLHILTDPWRINFEILDLSPTELPADICTAARATGVCISYEEGSPTICVQFTGDDYFVSTMMASCGNTPERKYGEDCPQDALATCPINFRDGNMMETSGYTSESSALVNASCGVD